MEHDPRASIPPRPSFDDLPVDKDGPRGNIWGLFGRDDQLGLLNYLTPDVTRQAAREIRSGLRISLDLPLDFFQPPSFNRKAFEHRIIHEGPFLTIDDEIHFNPQSATQWDGFKHCAYQDYKLFYNGVSLEEVKNSKKNGIHAWVDNGGIATRGVLIDFRRWVHSQAKKGGPSARDDDLFDASSKEDTVKPVFERTVISARDIRDVLAAQGTKVQPGDVLMVRTGFLAAYKSTFLSSQTTDEMKEKQHDALTGPIIGLEQSEDMLRLIWDSGAVAVASDSPALEAWPVPFDDNRFWLHEWLLAGWGCPIGEYFDLDRLAVECESAGRWSFFFSSIPLNLILMDEPSLYRTVRPLDGSKTRRPRSSTTGSGASGSGASVSPKSHVPAPGSDQTSTRE